MNRFRLAQALLSFLLAPIIPASMAAQTPQAAPPDPSSALDSALVAACKENQSEFAKYLAGDNPVAFRNLPEIERISLMQRFVLLDAPGRPLLDSDAQGRPILRCESSDATEEFKFGSPRIHANLAFIPVTIAGGRSVQFGLVREGDNWKLLSLGLLMIDIPQLEAQWDEQALEERERGAMENLKALAEAIETYRDSFGKLPEALAQLGPAKDGASPSAAKLIDADLASGKVGGYAFRYVVRPSPATDGAPSFELAAIPSEYGKSGRRSFLLGGDGKIHAADKRGAVATPDDPVVPSSDSGNS
jgi:hypothetical protein